jgi:hypothetical protein
VVPAGTEGAVLNAGPDGSCLAGVALAPRTADDDGDFVQVVLADGQDEVIRVHDQGQEAGGTRPGSAFEGGSVVFVIGTSETRDGCTYPEPREDALSPRGQRCLAAGDHVRHFYRERRYGHVRVSSRLAGS